MTPANILIIVFGQLGDVVLSLPALRAVREHFPDARITIAVGTACAAVIELAQVSDAMIAVDRVALRDGNRLESVRQIVRLVRDVRRRRFDFVLDLHSLSETNLLGFVSGASHRLYAHRRRRSLDWLSTLTPPREDLQKHLTERYLDVLVPLGIAGASTVPQIAPRADDVAFVEHLWQERGLNGTVLGVFPGAGNESRRWPLASFAALADQLTADGLARTAVFLGPEEEQLASEVRTRFPATTVIVDRLSVHQLVAALARLAVLVGNDTGPMHLAAAVGTPVVIVLDQRAPTQFVPRGAHVHAVNPAPLGEIAVGVVVAATRRLLGARASG